MSTYPKPSLRLVPAVVVLLLQFAASSLLAGPDDTLSREQVRTDLDRLEQLLTNNHAYLDLLQVDVKTELDSFEQTLPRPLTVRDFSLKLQKYAARFEDANTRVLSFHSLMKRGYLPFRLTYFQDQVLVLAQREQQALDEEYPFLRSINGVSVPDLLAKAAEYEANVSPHYHRHNALVSLVFIKQILFELGKLNGNKLTVELENEVGTTKTLDTKMTLILPNIVEYNYRNGIIANNIAYLRIKVMSNSQRRIDTLIAQMGRIKNSDGLVIDLRNIAGGTTDVLEALYPFFITKDDKHQVLEVAAFRKDGGDMHSEGYLKDRNLYPTSSTVYDKNQTEYLRSFGYNFKPAWAFPDAKFSNLHFLMVEPIKKDPRYYHYDKPVVILMNQGCVGASEVFLSAFQGLENIKLMGYPSAGSHGFGSIYRLPQSKVRIKLSTTTSYRPNGSRFSGTSIDPDIPAEVSLTDAIGKTDKLLNQAIRYLFKLKHQ